MFNTDPYRMKHYPAKEERRMIAYYLVATGRLNKEPEDGEVVTEHFGDVREGDTSITIMDV